MSSEKAPSLCPAVCADGCLRCAGRGGAEYWKNESGAVVAQLSVYGNVSTFSLSAEICDTGTGLTVSVRDPCPGLSAKGEERAVTAVADMVAQYLENELMNNRRCFVQDRHYAV